jgi:hypothetical protein
VKFVDAHTPAGAVPLIVGHNIHGECRFAA